VKYIRYAESGRIHWIEILAKLDSENKQRWKELWTPRGKGLILKTIKTDFKFVCANDVPRVTMSARCLQYQKPLVFPDRITVLHKLRPILKPDADSFTLDALILSEKNRRVAAKCVEEIVVYDYRLGKKAPMDDWVYEGLSRILEEQELWKQQCQLKLRELDGVVQDVERQNGYTI
jgi:acyl-CoA thioesterase FadM